MTQKFGKGLACCWWENDDLSSLSKHVIRVEHEVHLHISGAHPSCVCCLGWVSWSQHKSTQDALWISSLPWVTAERHCHTTAHPSDEVILWDFKTPKQNTNVICKYKTLSVTFWESGGVSFGENMLSYKRITVVLSTGCIVPYGTQWK